MEKNVAVIICAAGASSRFGEKTKKVFTKVDNKIVFLRSIDLFSEHPDVKQIILAVAKEDIERVRINHGAFLDFNNVHLTEGGSERFETVQKAMKLLKNDIQYVAIHDAARCCAKTEWIDEVIKKAQKTKAAMLACPIVSTVKKVIDGLIQGTVDRRGLYEAQTPQIFEIELLKKAYANIDNLDKATLSDDSMLVEALGQKVSIVETDRSNLKITTKEDVAIAEGILKSREKPSLGPIHPFEEAQW